jgi:DNA-binding beta-propeller fold protein YncE
MTNDICLRRRRSSPHRLWLFATSALAASTLTGCLDSGASDRPELVWGVQGIDKGELQKPRAIAIDKYDQIYLVDMTARIQVYDADGQYLRGWRTPVSKNGRPTGLTMAKSGRLLVPDTHYYQVLTYETDGTLIEDATLGGEMGTGPGQFCWVTDVVEDSKGNLYVSEYGDADRIQKFSPDGDFLLQWGGTGEEPGQFRRPQSMAVDEQDHIWVADSCNHRIQVFDAEGKLLDHWGAEGAEPGKLYYPYSVALDGKGHVYICEYGNHRVQKFTLAGKSVACWGSRGREPGQLNNPWAIAFDSQGRLNVLDSNNHRVQRIRF